MFVKEPTFFQFTDLFLIYRKEHSTHRARQLKKICFAYYLVQSYVILFLRRTCFFFLSFFFVFFRYCVFCSQAPFFCTIPVRVFLVDHGWHFPSLCVFSCLTVCRCLHFFFYRSPTLDGVELETLEPATRLAPRKTRMAPQGQGADRRTLSRSVHNDRDSYNSGRVTSRPR